MRRDESMASDCRCEVGAEFSYDACAREGVTLVESVIALALVTLVCAGLFAVGLKAQRYGEHNRAEIEAASLGRQFLEEMVATGRDNLVQSGCTLRNPFTNDCIIAGRVVCVPRLEWHARDGSLTNAGDCAYVEAHVDVEYESPLLNRLVTNTYSTLIH